MQYIDIDGANLKSYLLQLYAATGSICRDFTVTIVTMLS